MGAGAAISVGSQMRADTTNRVRLNAHTTKVINRAAGQEVMGQVTTSSILPSAVQSPRRGAGGGTRSAGSSPLLKRLQPLRSRSREGHQLGSGPEKVLLLEGAAPVPKRQVHGFNERLLQLRSGKALATLRQGVQIQTVLAGP